MNSYEVPDPILNTPFEKPKQHWFIQEGEQPEKREGRRPSVVFPARDQKEPWATDGRILTPSKEYTTGFDLVLVGLIRERLEAWQNAAIPARRAPPTI